MDGQVSTVGPDQSDASEHFEWRIDPDASPGSLLPALADLLLDLAAREEAGKGNSACETAA